MLRFLRNANSLSKGNIGNARLQGLQTQLHLSDNQFNLALVSIFKPDVIFSVA